MRKPKYHQLPSLNGLKAFETAARHLSFTHAARELSVTQGAVSRQVKQLEEQLGVTLFQRLHRKLELTEHGRFLHLPLTKAFDTMADAVDRLKSRQQDLNLKVHPTFAIRWLIPRLYRFQSRHPDIRVRLTTSSINVDFTREDFDAGITHLGEEHPGVIREKILKEQLIPVCSPNLLKEPARQLEPRELKYFTLLHNNPDLKEWTTWADQRGTIGLSLDQGQVFEVDDAALQAATAGLGMALGDLFLVREELASGRLVAPFGLTPIRTGNYYFSQPDITGASEGVILFKNWLLKALNQDPAPDQVR